jgi:endonuclease G, mitochondrial
MFIFNRYRALMASLVAVVVLAGCSPKATQSLTQKKSVPPTPSVTAPQSTKPSTSIHLTLGNPSGATEANPDNYLMVKPQYVLSYNRSKGIPNWASWQLNRSWLGSVDRQDNFRPDDTLPASWPRVTPSVYTGSGYDKGHLVPSADRTKSVEDNSATFLMTNMMPQAPDNNRKTWEGLESYCRELVGQGKELYIIAGSSSNQIKSLKGKVAVPATTWKVVVVLDRPGAGLSGVSTNTRVIAVNLPNQQKINPDWKTYKVSVSQLEKLTGYNFLSNVSPTIQKAIESKVDNENATVDSPKLTKTTKQSGNCSPAYPDVCIPPPPPDLNCKDIPFKNFKVLPPDPHNFEGRNKNGIGCEK